MFSGIAAPIYFYNVPIRHGLWVLGGFLMWGRWRSRRKAFQEMRNLPVVHVAALGELIPDPHICRMKLHGFIVFVLDDGELTERHRGFTVHASDYFDRRPRILLRRPSPSAVEETRNIKNARAAPGCFCLSPPPPPPPPSPHGCSSLLLESPSAFMACHHYACVVAAHPCLTLRITHAWL